MEIKKTQELNPPDLGEGNEQLLFNGCRFQFCKMKTVREIDGDDVCRAICLYLMPLNCTPKNG